MKAKHAQKTVNIPLSKLQLGVYTPRTSYKPAYIRELAESIDNEGQHKPIIVQFKEDKEYPVIDGEYRVRAVTRLGHSLIRAEVKQLSDEEALFLALHINEMHGKRLDVIEEANHLQKMIDQYGYSHRKLAQKVHRPQSWVTQRLGLINRLAPEVKEKVITQVIAPTQVRSIVTLPKEEQKKVAEFVERENPTIKETQFLVDLVKEEPSKAEELLEKDRDSLKAEMKHEEIVETKERLEEVIIGKDRKQWVEEHVCMGCGKHFRINWREGTVEWA